MQSSLKLLVKLTKLSALCIDVGRIFVTALHIWKELCTLKSMRCPTSVFVRNHCHSCLQKFSLQNYYEHYGGALGPLFSSSK